MIDHASAKVSDANATETHARNSQTLAELGHRDSLAVPPENLVRDDGRVVVW